MDILTVKYWLLIFIGIILFLGGLAYFIFQQNFIDKSYLEQMNHQGQRSSAGSRRKNARTANRRKQQQQVNIDSNNNNMRDEEEEEEEQQKIVLPETTTEKETSRQHSDEDSAEKENFEDSSQTISSPRPPVRVEDEQEPTIPLKQRHKNKTMNKSSSSEESMIPSKPQASVAPVKQIPLYPPIRDSSNNGKSSQDNYSKTNGHSNSPPSYNIYTYSSYNPVPPRFRQQQKNEAAYFPQRHRRRRGGGSSKRSSFPPDSAARSNDFIPSSIKEQEEYQEQEEEQQQQQQHQEYRPIYCSELEASMDYVQQQPELSMHNGYSSGSDILTGKSLYHPNKYL